MCGICGKFAFSSDYYPTQKTWTLCAGRGPSRPDSQGIHLDEPLGWAWRSAVSIGGRPALVNEDGTIWAALNGEIAFAICEASSGRPCVKTGTDTGSAGSPVRGIRRCVAQCTGMFAFAFITPRQRLLIA
jgi:asparagine synthetase B (glutamine-hydrolysing)